MRNTALFLLVFSATGAISAAERITATGKVVDADGHPVAHAAVLVYSAGVKTGFNQFCPTCYADCGKRAFTGDDGAYSIPGLSSDLVFNLLVVRDGYAAKFVKKVDPAKGPAETASLAKRAPVDAAQMIRGIVVDQHGTPVRDALVEQQGAMTNDGGRSFGDGGWIDLMSVTNDHGEFALAYGKPLKGAIVAITARGMATKLATVPGASDSTKIALTEGATIRGRLVANGRPVANAELGLETHNRFSGNYLSEVRIGTDADGNFAFTNVPAGRVWNLYGKMESLAGRDLVSDVKLCATKDDGQDVNVGDIQVRPSYTLSGRVVLDDGKTLPAGMHVNLGRDEVGDNQTLVLATDGRFEFHGLSDGVYNLGPSVKGYEPEDRTRLELLIESNQSGMTVPMRPRDSTNEP